MKIRILIFILTAGTLNMASAITPSQLRDGTVEFAKWTVGGSPAFNQTERDDLLVRNPTAQVLIVTPTAFELQVSTSGLRFQNYSDFKKAVEDKEHLDGKILDLRPSDYKARRADVDALKAENNKR